MSVMISTIDGTMAVLLTQIDGSEHSLPLRMRDFGGGETVKIQDNSATILFREQEYPFASCWARMRGPELHVFLPLGPYASVSIASATLPASINHPTRST